MVLVERRRQLSVRRVVADVTFVFVALAIGLFTSVPSLCHAASPSPSPSPSMAPCSTWTPNSVQNVTVDGYARFGAAEGCGAELINVSVTFFTLPQSTIALDGWSMRGGGYVEIQGPPSAPWSVRDVAVVVTNSVIETSGGPAVSVVLGAGYDATATITGGGVSLRNVNLYCSGSRLWSTGALKQPKTVAESASVLSVALAPTLDVSVPNVTIDRFFVTAIESDLRSVVTATANATAAVASVAAARYDGGGTPAWVTVSSSALNLLRCNATAVVWQGSAGALPNDAAAVSAVAGLAFGKLVSVGLSVESTAVTVMHSRLESAVTLPTTAYAYAGSTVAGVAVGYANSPVTVANRTTFYVGWSNATSISTSSYNAFAYAGSTVAGVAVSQAPSVTIANSTTFYVGWSNATSISTITNFNYACAGSSVAGVAVVVASSITIANSTTFCVGWSQATSISTITCNNNNYAYAGSSVAGVAIGQVPFTSPVTVANSTTFYVGWSQAISISTITSTSGKNVACAGSSVAGVAIGQAPSASVTVANSTTFYVGWSQATSISTSNSYANADVGSSVAGVASTSSVQSLALNVTSAANVSACARGSSAAISCMSLAQSASGILCCTVLSEPDGAFPLLEPLGPLSLPEVTVPTFYHQPPPPSNQGAGLLHDDTNTTTVSKAVTRSPSPWASTTSASSSYSLALRRVTSSGTTGPRRPFPSNSKWSSSSSVSPTLHAATQPFRTAAAPSPTPHPARRDAVQGLGLGLDPITVTAVVATGYGSTAVAAALSPTSGNKASTASRLVSGAECTVFGDQDLSSSFPQPDDWSLMPGFIGSETTLGNDGGSAANAAASKVLTTVVLVTMAWACNAVVWATDRRSIGL